MYKPRSIYAEVALKTILVKLGIEEESEGEKNKYQKKKELMVKKSCFVTLHKENSLRGCIGTAVQGKFIGGNKRKCHFGWFQ